MNWSQILLVTKREFITQVRNKTFLVLTFLTPLIIIGIGILIGVLSRVNKEQKVIAVVDQSNLFQGSFKTNDDFSYHFYTKSEIQSIKDTLEESNYLNALLVIPQSSSFDSIEKNTELYTQGSSGISLKNGLESKLEKTLSEKKLKHEGITEEKLQELKSNFNLNVFNVKKLDKESGEFSKDNQGNDIVKLIVAGVLTYIIFMFIMIYGVKVMRSVTEEKSSRIVEIIISSIKPFNLMMGKIFGVTLVAITQFIIWIAMLGILSLVSYFVLGISTASNISENDLKQAQQLASNPELMQEATLAIENLLAMNLPLIIGCFIIYFIFGYLFYSSIFAAIGSAVDNDADTQQFTFLPMFPLMIATYGSFFAVWNNPEGPVAFWLSMIPLTSPICMITRLPYEVAWWEILLSLGLLILATIGMVKIGAKIYKTGILMYGKKVTFKELWKWLRQPA